MNIFITTLIKQLQKVQQQGVETVVITDFDGNEYGYDGLEVDEEGVCQFVISTEQNWPVHSNPLHSYL